MGRKWKEGNGGEEFTRWVEKNGRGFKGFVRKMGFIERDIT